MSPTVAEMVRKPRIKPERMAWIVLLVSFIVFCLLCLTLTVGVRFFLFESDTSMRTLLEVARGTVTMTESSQADLVGRVVLDEFEISNGTEINANEFSQASVRFIDTEQDNHLIAAVTLRSESSLTMIDALRPRFDWSVSRYNIDLRNFRGRMDVFVVDELTREIRLTIRTHDGTLVYINSSGNFMIEATDARIRVVSRSGTATLVSNAPSRDGFAIPEGQQGVLNAGSEVVLLTPAYVDLLENPLFRELGNTPIGSRPLGWDCANSVDDGPMGLFSAESLDGRRVLHLVRGSNASAHGETRCGQSFRPASTGVSVNSLSELILRTTFYINYQSLSICGIEGSECPLMVRVDYVDVNGNARQWFHGFYAGADPALGYPIRCDSCIIDHDRVNFRNWYTYETNLFTMFPADQRPAAILNVQIYASGHQYDVYVNEVSLLGSVVQLNGTDAP